MLKRLAQSFREMRTLGRGHPQFKSCKKHKGMTFDGAQAPLEKVLDKQKHHRNHPTYKIRLNGRWYRFALHREIQGEITRLQVTREDVYITLTEDFSEIKYEPKTGKAEGFDFGITEDFLIGITAKPTRHVLKLNAKQLAAAQNVYSRKVIQERERKNVARIHKKTANQRTDHHWKLAIDLCRDFEFCSLKT